MWYGSDTNTTSWPTNTSGTRFYIGELGIHGTKTTANFNTSMATAAINSGGFVQGYWFLGSKPSSGYTDYSWGQHMAQLAVQQANSYPTSYYLSCIWADVEISTYWNGSTSANYQTVSGFCKELDALGYGHGIYSAPSQWNAVCGSNSASAITNGGWTSEPQESSPPTSMANALTFSDLPHSAINLWQYVASNSVDYDAYID